MYTVYIILKLKHIPFKAATKVFESLHFLFHIKEGVLIKGGHYNRGSTVCNINLKNALSKLQLQVRYTIRDTFYLEFILIHQL